MWLDYYVTRSKHHLLAWWLGSLSLTASAKGFEMFAFRLESTIRIFREAHAGAHKADSSLDEDKPAELWLSWSHTNMALVPSSSPAPCKCYQKQRSVFFCYYDGWCSFRNSKPRQGPQSSCSAPVLPRDRESAKYAILIFFSEDIFKSKKK